LTLAFDNYLVSYIAGMARLSTQPRNNPVV
jgi:hypothetical protein